LIVEKGNPLGGAAVQSLVWMQAFHELGYEVSQMKFENDNRPVKEKFDWVNLVPVYNPAKKRIRSWYTYKLPRYFEVLKKERPQYVYSSIPKWYFFYINIFCKIFKIKHIIRLPSDEMVDNRIYLTESKIDAFFIKLSYYTADLILAQNEYQYQQIKKVFPKKQILKVYNPIVVKQEFLRKKKARQGYFAWMANFRHRKNLALLFEIAQTLPMEQFKIAGVPLSPLDEETATSIVALKKLNNVEFMGGIAREEILPFLSKAKYLLNTSRYEGFSNTFLESMCTGTPVLTTDTANPDNLILDQELGFVYKNASQLADKIKEISELDYLKWSANCIKYVNLNHDHIYLGRILKNKLEQL
jgi:glycosyltransferase involved in cell wall biosynthesis